MSSNILPTEIVKVKASDGTLLYARMIKPAGFTAGKEIPGCRHGLWRPRRPDRRKRLVRIVLGPGARAQRLRRLAAR